MRASTSRAMPCAFADVSDPAKGLVFDGRTAEDFKLLNGTWVAVGALACRRAGDRVAGHVRRHRHRRGQGLRRACGLVECRGLQTRDR